MNFNTNVNKEVVDSILESALWSKAKITVKSRMDESSANEGEVGTVAEYETGIANTYEEPTTIEAPEEEEEVTNFTLDDLQYVLDNLEEDDLMEHAMSMLDIFDVAHEQLAEEEEDEEEDEEEEEDDLEEESEEERKEKHLGARGMKTTKGGKGLHSRIQQQRRGESQATTGGAPTRRTRSSS